MFLKKYWFYLLAIPVLAVVIVLLIFLIPKDVDFEITRFDGIVVDIGKSQKLSYEISVDGAICSFEIDDESIATLDGDNVKGVSAGATVVTLTAKYGNKILNKTASITVEEGLKVVASNVEVAVGENSAIEYSVFLNGNLCEEVNVEFVPGNSSVAKVENGEIVGVVAGNTALTITARLGNRTASKVINVRVVEVYELPFQVLVNNEEISEEVASVVGKQNVFSIRYEGSTSISCEDVNIEIVRLPGADINTFVVKANSVGRFEIRILAGDKERIIVLVAE